MGQIIPATAAIYTRTIAEEYALAAYTQVDGVLLALEDEDEPVAGLYVRPVTAAEFNEIVEAANIASLLLPVLAEMSNTEQLHTVPSQDSMLISGEKILELRDALDHLWDGFRDLDKTLIHRESWTDHAKEIGRERFALDYSRGPACCVDWEAWADVLAKTEYTEIVLDGETYLYEK